MQLKVKELTKLIELGAKDLKDQNHVLKAKIMEEQLSHEETRRGVDRLRKNGISLDVDLTKAREEIVQLNRELEDKSTKISELKDAVNELEQTRVSVANATGTRKFWIVGDFKVYEESDDEKVIYFSGKCRGDNAIEYDASRPDQVKRDGLPVTGRIN